MMGFRAWSSLYFLHLRRERVKNPSCEEQRPTTPAMTDRTLKPRAYISLQKLLLVWYLVTVTRKVASTDGLKNEEKFGLIDISRI